MTQALWRELTDQQRKTLDLLQQNYTSKEIARECGMSTSGVNQRVNALLRKAGCTDRRELARLYREQCEQLPKQSLQLGSGMYFPQMSIPELITTTVTQTDEKSRCAQGGDPLPETPPSKHPFYSALIDTELNWRDLALALFFVREVLLYAR